MDLDRTEIINILESSPKVIKANMVLLSDLYRKETGLKVCTTCPSGIQVMILTLKNIYKVVNFIFIREVAQYKIKKGDRFTISNANLTDKKAIEFLKAEPSRIHLFSKFPENWKQLVYGDFVEKEKKIEKQIVIEAEMIAKYLSMKLDREKLSKMKLAELRKEFPGVKAKSVKDYVNIIAPIEESGDSENDGDSTGNSGNSEKTPEQIAEEEAEKAALEASK